MFSIFKEISLFDQPIILELKCFYFGNAFGSICLAGEELILQRSVV